MSQNFSAKLTNLLTSPREVQSALTLRKKKYIEMSVTASNLELAEKKAILEEKDGWTVLRKNKKSIRMAKDKPFDEILEDDIWCILAQMGFKVLSKGRFFRIPVGKNITDRQIDVFAKDDDSVLLIECTGSEDIKRKSLTHLIDKIISIRSDVFNSIKQHFGIDPKLKMKWGIATKNIEWIDNDISKCNQENIFIIKDDQINYFNKLTHHFRLAARYQLLAYIFTNEEIPGLKLVVPATKGRMGGRTFYNFLIKPHDLLKIAYISHKKGTSPDDFETYQRMLQPNRLKKNAY